MFLAWIWEALGGVVKYDCRSVIIRFFIFDIYCWVFLIIGLRLWLTGQLD
jgi:hypothetical protein